MFTTYKDVRRLDPEKGVNKPYDNFHVRGVFRSFLRDKGIKFRHFSRGERKREREREQ